MYWTWINGRPTMQSPDPTDHKLALKTQGNTDHPPTPITRTTTNKATRILGVCLSPDGDFTTQLQVLKKKADDYAHRLRSPRLTPQDVHTFHRTTYGPSMGYVLPAISVDEEELGAVQTNILAAILNKLGHSSKTPTAIRHGPLEMGGLALIDLRTEVGIYQIQYMRNAVYSDTEPGKLITMSLMYSQLESGISEPLLEHPHIHLPYLTPTWTMSLRQYLYQHNITITLTDQYKVSLKGPGDSCIMVRQLLLPYTTSQQTDINLVRLHLQITTLSDMATNDDTNACPYHITGQRRPQQVINNNTWPRQEHITKSQTRLWTRYIAASFLRYGTKWRVPWHLPAPPPTYHKQ
jgi:hypothetical protein